VTTEQIRDLVSRVRYSFETRGESRIVLMWLESGAGLPAHYHPRQEERWSVVQGRARFQLGRL
jgi:quercetin dioxygenase-like cupin family protein